IKLCRLDTPIIFIEARINLSRFVVTGCAAKTSATVTFPSLNLISLFAFCFNIWLNGVGTINPDTNKIPKHLFQGYLNIYNNYFKAPWMPDRTEANPNELNQDDARYGFRCCHLKNIWTAPLPPETELSRQMTTSTT